MTPKCAPQESGRMIDAEAKREFWETGYVRLGKLLDDDEVAVIRDAIRDCDQMNACHAAVKEKFEAGQYPSFETIFVMNDVFTDNIFALACRKAAILDFVSEVFGDDAYLYHSKVVLKYPNTPGFKYHQDYYYWYEMGCLFPAMATCFIAIDAATRENGCLRFVPGSHLCGRINHVLTDGFSDSGCDPERVELLTERHGEVHMELAPGEAVAFHCNLLHGSDTNDSEASRLALLGCYNTRNNSPTNNNWTHPHYARQNRFAGKISSSHDMPDFDVSFQT